MCVCVCVCVCVCACVRACVRASNFIIWSVSSLMCHVYCSWSMWVGLMNEWKFIYNAHTHTKNPHRTTRVHSCQVYLFSFPLKKNQFLNMCYLSMRSRGIWERIFNDCILFYWWLSDIWNFLLGRIHFHAVLGYVTSYTVKGQCPPPPPPPTLPPPPARCAVCGQTRRRKPSKWSQFGGSGESHSIDSKRTVDEREARGTKEDAEGRGWGGVREVREGGRWEEEEDTVICGGQTSAGQADTRIQVATWTQHAVGTNPTGRHRNTVLTVRSFLSRHKA